MSTEAKNRLEVTPEIVQLVEVQMHEGPILIPGTTYAKAVFWPPLLNQKENYFSSQIGLYQT